MRIVFMGTPDFSVPALTGLYEAGHTILGVVTQPDKPRGRGGAVSCTPVKEEALRLGLPVYQPRRVRAGDFLETVRELAPDVIVVIAFGQILPQALLDIPRYGCINVHASLLPRLPRRGAHSVGRDQRREGDRNNGDADGRRPGHRRHAEEAGDSDCAGRNRRQPF